MNTPKAPEGIFVLQMTPQLSSRSWSPCIHSPITEFSVCDCFRLGKHSEHGRHPLLVTLSRSSEVVCILANRRQLSQHPHISIKPNFIPEDRKVESILLKQPRELIMSGTNLQEVRIHNDTLFHNCKKYGVVVGSTFQLCPLKSGLVGTASSQSSSQSLTSPNPSPSIQFPPTSVRGRT